MIRFLKWLFSPAPFDCLVGDREGLLISSEPRCVGCGYSLNMLPEEGRCPECGRDYDRITRFVKIRRPLCGSAVVLLPTACAGASFAIAALPIWRPFGGELVPALCVLLALLMVFIGNGVGVALFLRWIVVKSRVRRQLGGRKAASKHAAWARPFGISLAILLYIVTLAGSIALLVTIGSLPVS